MKTKVRNVIAGVSATALVVAILSSPTLAAEPLGCYGRLDPVFVRKAVDQILAEEEYNFASFSNKLTRTLMKGGRAGFWDLPGFLTHSNIDRENSAASCFPQIDAILDARKKAQLAEREAAREAENKRAQGQAEEQKRLAEEQKEQETRYAEARARERAELAAIEVERAKQRNEREKVEAEIEAKRKAELDAIEEDRAKRREAERAAERERLQKAAEEQAKIDAENRQRAAAEARKPENRLVNAYKVYSNVAFCNEVRQGYAYVWINDVEFERAKVAVKAIEDALKAEKADIDTKTLWQKAVQEARGWQADQWSCQQAYSTLRGLSPTSMYPIQKP
jgi:hypothetical protein